MRLLHLCLLILLCTCGRAQIGNVCHTETPDDWKPYTAAELANAKNNTDTLLPTVYMEVDYDIVDSLGGVAEAEAFIRGAFEEVAAVYRRDVTTDPQLVLYIHTEPTSYTATTSGASLNEFMDARPTIPANVGMLNSFRASGGIAYVDAVCSNMNYAFSSLDPTYEDHELYSWTVNVIGHELGHLLGSRHTQACAWNGNNTAIDGCWPSEGDCPRPQVPKRGSMMSYCHLNQGAVNDLRILPQPAAAMRAGMLRTGCVATKPAGPPPCEAFEVTVSIATDLHPRETKWYITTALGDTLVESRAYAKHEDRTTINTSVCLPDGCYVFIITDPDGISSERYLDGSYTLTAAGETRAAGGEFVTEDRRSFCLGEGEPAICDFLDLSAVQPYGGNQDNGTAEVAADGLGVTLRGNAWKSIPLPYVITPATIVETEFRGGPMGEIHGLGLDEDYVLSSNRTFRLGGSQNWGFANYATYPQGGGGWVQARIPVGEFYTGEMSELFFVSDKDAGTADNVSEFRNVRVHEGECAAIAPTLPLANPAPAAAPTTYTSDTPTDWLVSDQIGRVVYQHPTKAVTFRLNDAHLKTGIYFVSYLTDEGRAVERVFVR